MSPPGGEQAPAPGQLLGPALLIGLLAVSLAAGILVYRARTPDLALEVVSFDRELDEKPGPAEIVFFVRFDEPDARVEIVGRNLVLARTLAPSISLASEERLRCLWDGLDDDGEEVEPGRYRLRVTLPGQDREMVFPRRLDIQPGTPVVSPSVADPCAAS